MEVNSPNIEKPDQRACFLEDDHHGMSYRCSFCKKGFSNAQALGGHMNIHRRDRAKLREFSGETLTLMESGQKNSSENDNSQESLSPDRSHEKSCHHKRIGVSSMEEEEEDDHDHGKEVMQLPLFVYTPAINKRGKFKKTVVKGHQEFQPLSLSVYRKKMKTDAEKHAEKGKMGLDLELRLGPEP